MNLNRKIFTFIFITFAFTVVLHSQSSKEQQLLDNLNKNPNSFNAYREVLVYYYNQRDYENRLKYARQAIKRIGPNSYFYRVIGDAYKVFGEYQNSKTAYQEAIKIEPTSGYLYNRMGLLYMRMEYYHKAETAFLAAIHYSSSDGLAMKGIYYNNLGETYEGLSEFTKAYESYQQSLKFYPGYENAAENKERLEKERGL